MDENILEDVVFPQYYEWHAEMDKIAKVLDLSINPDEMFELYERTDANFKSIFTEAASKSRQNREEMAATVPLLFNDLESHLGWVAYLNALQHSHDIHTRRFGETIAVGLLATYIINLIHGRPDPLAQAKKKAK